VLGFAECPMTTTGERDNRHSGPSHPGSAIMTLCSSLGIGRN